MNARKAYINWSSGKDAALAQYLMRLHGTHSADLLFTTLQKQTQRVSIHGLRKALLYRQAEAMGMEIRIAELPENTDMDSYAAVMSSELSLLKNKGYTDCIFGDVHLQDLRVYRERQLASHGICAHFPLWGTDSREVVRKSIALGFRSIIICISEDRLDKSFLGRILDEDCLQDFPKNIDPCGENGEFHTFCFDGPVFHSPVLYTIGERVRKTYKNPTPGEPDAVYRFLDLR